MDRTTYCDPRIVDTINAGFVAVRVDADRRPDVNARYNLDGWPTTALLTPDGEILTGSTYLPPAAMASMLESGSAAFRGRYDELVERGRASAEARRAALAQGRYEPDGEAPAWLASRMVEEHDREFGGFGSGGKFLHAALLEFALAYGRRTRDERARAVAARSLDGVCRGAIFDEVDGGFFRYASGRDFTRPHTEKMLEDQAAMAAVLVEASVLLGRPDYRTRALDVIRYVRRTLCDPAAGGFFASQQPDDEYYALSGSIRDSMDPPGVDPTLFTDLNAQAIGAWLDAAGTLDDPSLADFAVLSASRVLDATYHPAHGHRHWTDGDAAGDLLGDQVHAAAARLRLFHVTRDRAHLDLAGQVMRTAMRRFEDPAGGGLFDRVPGGADEVGRLRDPLKPLALNGLAARVMLRLATAEHEPEWELHARRTLGAVTGTYRSHGLAAAPYALAVLELPS
jgi:uncharacterized protein YyaL (SSP411 family)